MLGIKHRNATRITKQHSERNLQLITTSALYMATQLRANHYKHCNRQTKFRTVHHVYCWIQAYWRLSNRYSDTYDCFANEIKGVAVQSGYENMFYVYGSMHRWSTLITVQRDATQSSLFIILQIHSICFGCQQHPSSGVHKTVTTASGTAASLATLDGGSCRKNTTSTGGCSYSFVYSWWWVWLTPEACRVNLQNNK